MRIGLAYNQKPDTANSAAEPSSTNDAFAEWDDPSTIAAVEQALGLFGSVVRLEADQAFPQQVALTRPDLVFNMAEGLRGQSREALVPAICEYLNIPYTGGAPGGSAEKSKPITGRQYAAAPLPRIATVNSGPGRYVSTSTGSA